MSEAKKDGGGRGSRLAVMVDGVPMAEEEARATWTEFSAHMDANRGDADGFARSRGFVSARPEFVDGRAVLVLRTTEALPERPARTPEGAQRSGGGRKRRR